MAPVVEEAVSGMWRSQDMTLVLMKFERDTVKRDLLRIGQLGCCQFRHENDEAPHKDHVQGVRDAELLEKHCRHFREMLHRWRHLRRSGTWPPRAPQPSLPDGYCWYEETLDLEKTGTALPDGRGGVTLRSVGEHEGDLKSDAEKFGEFRERFREWYFRYQVLQSKTVQSIANGTGSGATTAFVVGAAIQRSKAALVFKMHQRRSRRNAALEPACDQRGIPDGGFAAVPSIPSPDTALLLAGKAGDTDPQELLYDTYFTESGQPEDWVVVVSVSFSEVVRNRVLQLLISQDAKVSVLTASAEEARRSDWKPPGVGIGDFRLPTSPADLREMTSQAHDQMVSSLEMMVQTRTSIQRTLEVIAPALVEWEQTASVHKTVSLTLGQLRRTSPSSYEGHAWLPSKHVAYVRSALAAGGVRAAKLFEREELRRSDKAGRPTYFEMNEFSSVFQGIVDSYGTPRYKEVNPAIFTIITFPYLFGVMYGDIGHGLIVTAAAVAMIAFQGKLKSVKNEMFQMLFVARYLLFLMGLYATFMGFLYNDCFSLMLEYSPSRYQYAHGWETSGPTMGVIDPICHENGEGPCAAVMTPAEGPTPFGFDVAWMETTNKIDVYNSFKEKHAVILGVTQMMLGLFLQFLNHIYFAKETGDYKRIFFGFIPEVVFLGCTFGYMCFIIIYKWVTPTPVGTNRAANLLETMTNFFLSPGGGPSLAPGHELYDGQAQVQVYLLMAAAIAVVPFMLIPIPFLEWQKAQKTERVRKELERLKEEEPDEMMPLLSKEQEAVLRDEAPPVDMQEVVIKQVIHCIEFVLGSVSNTASYLRLWALSLAHAQLSEVFWTFAFMLPFNTAGESGGFLSGAFITYCGFAVWITATIGVLVLMEALSAFLHALRLHWVEFQNKFYYADGIPFDPLNFARRLQEADLPPGPWEKVSAI
eukprot:Hpha_TRINITY_DN15226_c0_g9::TRINITY_DN15226_c0_g9_i1::g.65510::m.65510/K02154/ATPeV0A, ATP6N; V-type H+-transporting ATPase subunit a